MIEVLEAEFTLLHHPLAPAAPAMPEAGDAGAESPDITAKDALNDSDLRREYSLRMLIHGLHWLGTFHYMPSLGRCCARTAQC